MFSEIKLHKWRQFNNVHIELDKRMTVLTGENGTGKTTILNILSKHFGWNLQLISTLLPPASTKLGRLIWSDVWDAIISDLDVQPGSTEVGTIKYPDGRECKLMVQPRGDQAQYNPQYTNQQAVFRATHPLPPTGFHVSPNH